MPTTKSRPKLTREALQRTMQPVNTCKVKGFMETLDPESLEVLEEALAMEKMPASAVRHLLTTAGFDSEEIPPETSIQEHRRGRRPCRCSD